jgi:hypothetical protein
MQHPAVGWLYAIERRGNAKEFLWQAQFAGFKDTGGKVGVKPFDPLPCEAPLGRADGKDAQALYPEKQHIVPFTFARQIVGKGGTRATASPANAIGNLTWLTHQQNGLDALADRWTVMDRERDAENLKARGMFSRSVTDDALALYEEIRMAVLNQEQAKAQPLFESFCNARASWIVEQMRNWLEEPLSDEASEWLRG